MPLFPTMLVALLALQPAQAPAGDQLTDRLIAALPDGDRLGAIEDQADPAELGRLEALNPGQTEAIRPVLEAYAVCESTMRGAMTRRAFERLAAELGEAKVERLIAFYRDEDPGTFVGLAQRLEQGEALSEGERAEHDRIAAAYPIREFVDLMQTSLMAYMMEELTLAELGRCEAERSAALDRLGLRFDEEGAVAE